MSSVESVSAFERRLNASIPQQTIRSEIADRLKNIGRTAKIAGFRPGKIPAKVLEQHYGAKAYQEALSEAVQRSFAEAIQLNKLRIVGHPRFELKNNSMNPEVIEYSAVFEVYPDVVMADISDETMERLVCELTQADIDGAILKLRKQRATYEPVDRAAQDEDRVHISFFGEYNGEIFKGGEPVDDKFVLGASKLLSEFENTIRGMKPGDVRSFDMNLSDDYHVSDLAGKLVTFTITLNGVEEPKLPEIDKAFAESIGVSSGDVSKLESEVRTNLQREMDQRLQSRNRKSAMEVLLKACRFDVPKTLVDQEANNLMMQAAKDLENNGMKIDDTGLASGSFNERAEVRVKLGLLITYLAQQHDLYATSEQVRALINNYAQSFENPDDMVNWLYSNPDKLKGVENLAMEDNITSWTMKQAKTTDKVVHFDELMGK